MIHWCFGLVAQLFNARVFGFVQRRSAEFGASLRSLEGFDSLWKPVPLGQLGSSNTIASKQSELMLFPKVPLASAVRNY